MNSTNGHSHIRNTAAELKASERGAEIPPKKGIEVKAVSTNKDFVDIMIEGTSRVGSDNVLYDEQGNVIGKLNGNAYRDYRSKDESIGKE